MPNEQEILAVRHIADTFHAVFCGTEHGGKPEDVVFNVVGPEEKCSYYVEEQLENTWSWPSHVKWYDQAVNLCIALAQDEIEEPELVVKFLQDIASIVGKVHKMSPRSGIASDLVTMLLVSGPLPPAPSPTIAPPTGFAGFDSGSTE